MHSTRIQQLYTSLVQDAVSHCLVALLQFRTIQDQVHSFQLNEYVEVVGQGLGTAFSAMNPLKESMFGVRHVGMEATIIVRFNGLNTMNSALLAVDINAIYIAISSRNKAQTDHSISLILISVLYIPMRCKIMYISVAFSPYWNHCYSFIRF